MKNCIANLRIGDTIVVGEARHEYEILGFDSDMVRLGYWVEGRIYQSYLMNDELYCIVAIKKKR